MPEQALSLYFTPLMLVLNLALRRCLHPGNYSEQGAFAASVPAKQGIAASFLIFGTQIPEYPVALIALTNLIKGYPH